jgi:hypothetical protein
MSQATQVTGTSEVPVTCKKRIWGLMTRQEETAMKAKKHLQIPAIPLWWPDLPGDWRAWLPSRGNVLFTLLVVVGLLWASSVGALPLHAPAAASTSTGTIAYQGRLADADGNPLTGTYNMIFRLYDAAAGGAPLWEEQWTGSNGVRVSDGLFNVMLGSLAPVPQDTVTGHSSLWLGITVGTDDEMTPRVQLGSVPFAVQALTVPDGSVTTAKIADGAVTQAKLGEDVSLEPPDGSITTEKLADDAVTSSKIAHAFGASSKELLNFVPRTGITGWDYAGDPGTSWVEFDATSTTSGSAVLLWIHTRYRHQYDGESFLFRKKGATEQYEQYELAASSGFHWHEEDCLIEVDGGQVFEYRKRAGGSADLLFVIRGWWEPAHQ